MTIHWINLVLLWFAFSAVFAKFCVGWFKTANSRSLPYPRLTFLFILFAWPILSVFVLYQMWRKR